MAYKPASQNPVKLTRDEQIDMWSNILAYFMWYPDLFLDACRPKDPETGELLGISLDFSQRMFLRSLFRMEQSYHCYPRGWGKTLVEILATYAKAILIPNYTQFMTAQSLKHASDLFKQKHAEVLKFFPFIENEFAKDPVIKEGRVEIYFKNGSMIGILPNTNDAKGSRANCITAEESALMNKEVFDDAIEPIVSEPYPNQRKQSQNNPFVINGLHFITTTYFASLDAFQHNKDVMEGMVNLQGQMAFGASWRLPVAFKRGRRAEEYISIKSRVSPLAWETNYESRWVGGAQDCLVPIHMLMEMRQIEEPELFGDGEHDYYMGIDVARSDNPDQCFTSIEVIKVYRDRYNAVRQIKSQNSFFSSSDNALSNFSGHVPQKPRKPWGEIIKPILSNPIASVAVVVIISYLIGFILGKIVKVPTGYLGIAELVMALILSYGIVLYSDKEADVLVKGSIVFFISLVIIMILIVAF